MDEIIDPTDLAPDHDQEGDLTASPELAALETHPDDIVPDNVDQKDPA